MSAEEGPYAIIPLWLLDGDVSDKAVRLYGILRSYADNRTLRCTPSRRELAARLRAADRKVVDRALVELVKVGALIIAAGPPRADGGQTANEYRLCRTPWGAGTSPPVVPAPPPPVALEPPPPVALEPPPPVALEPPGVRPAQTPPPVAPAPPPPVAPAPPLELQRTSPPTEGPQAPAAKDGRNAGSVVKAWIDRNQHRPPQQLVGQVAQKVKGLLAEGFSADDLDSALERMDEKHLGPSLLPSLLHDVVNGSTRTTHNSHANRGARPSWEA